MRAKKVARAPKKLKKIERKKFKRGKNKKNEVQGKNSPIVEKQAVEPVEFKVSHEESIPQTLQAEGKCRKKGIKGKVEQRTRPSPQVSEFLLPEDGKEEVKLEELVKASQKIAGQAVVKKQLKEVKKLKSLSVPLNRPQKEESISSSQEESIQEAIQEKETPRRRKIEGKVVQRTEPSLQVSEFHLTEVGKEKVKLEELVKASQKIAGQASVKKQLQKAKKLKSLSVPLSRPQQEKIKRTVAYEKVCNEVAKWDPVVKSNRDADQIIYPLKKPEIHLESFESTSERFITKHPVEEAVSKILQSSENVLDDKRTLTAAEEKALQAMSIEEAKLRHSELMRHRALISYKEAKARRQNKIKSKRYHRILKRERLKKMMKEFEELQKTDEAAALEKFLEADKLRILERVTLKHRNTGKWAKQQKIRAKYNPESRSNLKEDLAIGRQLREKIASSVSVEDIETNPEDKFFDDPSEKFLVEDPSTADPLPEKIVDDDFSSSQKLEILFQNSSKTEEKSHKTVKSSNSKPVKIRSVEEEMAFSSEATCLNSLVPDDITFGDEEIDDCDEGKITIDQAFADEELIAEFQEEKKASDEANRPQGIDLFLPGWGSWAGPGVKISKRKRRRFFIKPLEPQPPKNTLGNVILNEEKDKKAAVHQVNQLPFPFSNVKQFESYIRQPVGHTWNPQSSFQNIIAPKVIAKIGKIIDPIDSEDVVLEKKSEEVSTNARKNAESPKKLKLFEMLFTHIK